MSLPRVVSQFPQPKTPAGPSFRKETEEYEAWLAQQAPAAGPRKVVLRGKLGALTPHKGKGFVTEEQTVVGTLGSEGVTTTDGWGKWSKVARRQRTAITVLEGYEPYTITVPLLLDAGFLGIEDVEQEVKKLEWMGGRATMFQGKPGHPGQGETPLIELTSESRLVPYWCQSTRGSEGSVLYVVEKIEYNILGREWITPIRLPSGPRVGARTRQACTLTLLQYVGSSAATLDSAANRVAVLKEQQNTYGKTFIVEDGHNTFMKIAAYLNSTDASNIPTAAQEIQKANSKLGASVYKQLNRGAKVRIPESATPARS